MALPSATPASSSEDTRQKQDEYNSTRLAAKGDYVSACIGVRAPVALEKKKFRNHWVDFNEVLMHTCNKLTFEATSIQDGRSH